MFFADRIKNIAATDKVLEIGPGAHPHARSNVLLELDYGSEGVRAAQFGHSEKLVTDKKIVYYDGKKFPFEENDFDYVICSHVLEHIDNVPFFLSEIFRVSNKGYFEYPLIYYDYLFNYDVHINFVKFDGTTLYYMKKAETHLNEFIPVQKLLLDSFNAGHVKVINDLLPLIMEGFEWDKPFKVSKTENINDLVQKNFIMPKPSIDQTIPSASQLIKLLIKKVIRL